MGQGETSTAKAGKGVRVKGKASGKEKAGAGAGAAADTPDGVSVKRKSRSFCTTDSVTVLPAFMDSVSTAWILSSTAWILSALHGFCQHCMDSVSTAWILSALHGFCQACWNGAWILSSLLEWILSSLLEWCNCATLNQMQGHRRSDPRTDPACCHPTGTAVAPLKAS
jgi:hypothetical protein